MKAVPLSTWLLRLTATAVLAMIGFWAVAPSAQGQEVDCARVSYNERIILVCTSDESQNPSSRGSNNTSGADDPDDEPADNSSDDDPAEDAQASDSDDSASDADDSDDDNASESSEPDSDSASDDDDADPGDDPSSDVDRGDRGGRGRGADSDLGDVSGGADSDDAQDSDAQGQDRSTDSDATDDADQPESNDAGANDAGAADAGAADDGTAAEGDAPGAVTLAVDPPPDNLPIIAGLGALVAAGAAFFLAARHSRRADVATSDGGRRTPG